MFHDFPLFCIKENFLLSPGGNIARLRSDEQCLHFPYPAAPVGFNISAGGVVDQSRVLYGVRIKFSSQIRKDLLIIFILGKEIFQLQHS